MDYNAVKNGVLAALAAVGSWIANALGGWDASMQVLVAAQTMCPTYEHTVTSDCSINLVNSGVESVTITTL